MGGRTIRIGIVAGEASGDLLGAHLMSALRPQLPSVEFIGIGGPNMQGAGLQPMYPMEKLAVRGYVEVLRHYREIVDIRRRLKRALLEQPPDLFIGIDAPDFNLHLEQALKAHGIPTVHYVSPSIWAWRGGRIRRIARSVSRMLTVFPFEAALYQQAGVPVTYVGHPLADMLPDHPDRAGAREQLKLPLGVPVIALLPGSRQSELKYMAELFVQTAREVARQIPNVVFVVPLATRETRTLFEHALYRDAAAELRIHLLFGHAQDAMVAADAVLVASGTATLEAALLKRPMVITYRMPGLSWWIIKHKRYQPFVGLPNILLNAFVVPELLQEDATAPNLAQALVNYLSDPVTRARIERIFAALHLQLRRDNASSAAGAVLSMLAPVRG
jgi:lipid-A-disaccharide synthase